MASVETYSKLTETTITRTSATVKNSLFLANARGWMSLILIFTDTIALLIAFFIAINVRSGTLDNLYTFFYVKFLWVPILILIGIYVNNGLYPAVGISAVEEVRRISLSTSLLFLVIITLTFLLKSAEVYSRLIFLLAWGIALLLIPLARNFMRWVCVHLKIWGEPVAIIGFPDRRVEEVAAFFVKYPHKGLNPKVIFLEDTNQSVKGKTYQTQSIQRIDDCPQQFGIKTVLVLVPNWNWVGENLDKYRYHFERVILIQQQRKNYSLSASVSLDFNGVMGFQVRHNLLNPWAIVIKRLIDLLVSGVGLLILSPFLATLAVLIHRDSPGSVLYRQERLGRGGKIINVLKFRTMYSNADEVFEQHLKQNKQLMDEWKKYQKLKFDPRITHIGKFIRKFSLDELPQLWNILKGEMSLVGPRPILLNQRDLYGLALHDYIQVRPGVTGLWQVSGRNHTTFARRAELDVEYMQRWSIWLDIYIIFQTFKELVTRNGAY